MNPITDYDDIIDLPHPVSKTHAQMSMGERAAQFSPFSALTGYEDVLSETVRETVERIEISDERKEELDQLIAMVRSGAFESVKITYYIPDKMKSGGSYIAETSSSVRIDTYRSLLITARGSEIPITDIYDIEIV